MREALNFPEKRLDGRAAAKLQQQRLQQQQQLQRNHHTQRFPEQFVHMTYNNVLAEHNGLNCALVFVHADNPPHINTNMLSNYLHNLVLNPSQSSSPVLVQETRQCASLAANYLMHTDYFIGADSSFYTHLANKLSKHLQSPECVEALSWIARQILSAEPEQLHAIKDFEICVLTSGLLRNPQSELCRDATLLVGRELMQREAPSQQQKIRNTSALLTALCRWPQHDEARHMALRLAERILADKPLVRNMDQLAMSTSINALAKWPESGRAKEAILALAEGIRKNPASIQDIDEQQISNMLNALGKWPESERARETVRHLARHIAQDARLRQAMKAQGIANSLNSLSKWPDVDEMKNAALWLAERIVTDSALPKAMKKQELTTSMNGLSKWAAASPARDAGLALAERFIDHPHLQEMLDSWDTSMLLNALSKWPDSNRAKTLACMLAERISQDTEFFRMTTSQSVSNTLNGLSKWPEEQAIQDAVAQLSSHIRHNRQISQSMNTQEISSSFNALSKWPDLPQSLDAALVLAERIIADRRMRHHLDGVHVTNILNALSKWPQNEQIKEAAMALVERIEENPAMRQSLLPHHFASTMNALSKWPENDRVQAATLALVERVITEDSLPQLLTAVGFTNALNALGTLSKWNKAPQIEQAALILTEHFATDASLRQSIQREECVANAIVGLSKFSADKRTDFPASWLTKCIATDELIRQSTPPNKFATTLNAVSKWLDLPSAREAFLLMTERLVTDESLVPTLDIKATSSALNAVAKWSEHELVKDAAQRLAEHFMNHDTDLYTDKPQLFSNIFNNMDKWQKDPVIQPALWKLTALLENGTYTWKNFNLIDLTQISNTLMRMLNSDQDNTLEEQDRIKSILHDMAIYLELHTPLLNNADIRQVGLLFKSFASVQLQKALRPLAPTALNRVQELCHRDQLRDSHLEEIGNLCLGLLPLLRSPELTRFRQPALLTFNTLQPIIERKLQSFLDSQKTGPGLALRYKDDGNACDTRCPALTFYQILKAYSTVSQNWGPAYIKEERQAVKERKAELVQWVKATLERTRQTIEADLQENSWNVIAQIEAGGNPLEALDLRLNKELEYITQRHPPSQFSLSSSHSSMRTPPGKIEPVPPNVGATAHKLVNINGMPVKEAPSGEEATSPYSLYARLTGLPLVEVQLPGKLSVFMMARTFQYQGEPWRFDMFGGSRLTRGRNKQVKNILMGKSPNKSLLPAIRYSDSAPGSPFMALVKKLAPQREDWSRMQRALLEMVPHDHVAEGTLRTGWFNDVAGAQHPFKPLGPNGQRLALCPNDGCGFLKLGAAMRIPVIHASIASWSPDEKTKVGDSSIPPQALQHYPRNEEALAEAREVMQRQLQTLAERHQPQAGTSAGTGGRIAAEDMDLLSLYQLTVSGGYTGKRIRAVPSADEKLHIPPSTSAEFDRHGGDLLLGKPPYDKENLLPLPPERVATATQGDITAQFLSECFAMQYSYTGFDDHSGDDLNMLHSKGMLIILPEENWPPEFADMDLACSTEDMKIMSSWVNGRDRASIAQQIVSTGSLRVKDILMPGQLGAIPIPELRKRNMDTDGDDAFIYAGYPKLSAAIRQTMEERTALRGSERSFKPPKTAHSAFDSEGNYQAGRGKEIMAEQAGGKLMGLASNNATLFLSQPDEIRHKMAYHMMFGTYEGIDRQLRNGLFALLENRDNAPPRQALQAIAQQDVERAHLPEAREAAETLLQLIRQLPEQAPRPPQLSDALAEIFPQLANAYNQADNTPRRIEALLNNYPVCRLPHSEFPNGQPGLIKGQPELTMRNLFTISVKVGTDALKSDTGTDLFTHVMEKCESSIHAVPERIRHVPHTKQTARAIRDNRFDPEEARKTLTQIPTMAAGVMETAVEALQQVGLLSAPPPPAAQLSALRPQDITQHARNLSRRAAMAEPAITTMLKNLLKHSTGGQAQLAGLEHAVKSTGSLGDKLRYLMSSQTLSLQESAAKINDSLRYSIVLPPDSFTQGCRTILAALDDAEYKLCQRTNHFTQPGRVFCAVNTTLKSPDGLLWEIQFHTPQTFDLKEQFHDLYKQAQNARHQGSTFEQNRELLLPARQAFWAVPLPPGCEELDNWESFHVSAPQSSQSQARPAEKSRAIPPHLAIPVRHIAEQARKLEKCITPVLLPALAQYNGKLQGEQNWQSHLFKTEKSIARKIEQLQQTEQLSPETAMQRVRDGLSYVVVLPFERFYAAAQGIVSALKQNNVAVMRINNAFTAENTPYAGLNMNLRSNGAVQGDFELQFHTGPSLHAKLKTHKHYEKLRQLPEVPPGDYQDEGAVEFAASREQLLHKLREAAMQVKRPEGIDKIPSFNRYADQT